jgi:hypothetical protein
LLDICILRSTIIIMSVMLETLAFKDVEQAKIIRRKIKEHKS